jgi:hypothetical protein
MVAEFFARTHKLTDGQTEKYANYHFSLTGESAEDLFLDLTRIFKYLHTPK